MYEFLAPWGVLAPAVSAAIAYFTVTEMRRREQLRMIEDSSSPAEDTSLSVMHG